MVHKKNNLILIIPAFLLVGTAIGVQTGSLLKHTLTGLLVGIIVYVVLSIRNKKKL
ncbi:hypothetical protein [Polaribacter tangerinus]|uniref:hypothetical protein n=1 Tax=Polaribacter tangerinus TaxID=1920034 RepID=UPI0018E96DCA|nr:hypothetical protein [Polaribacter tangerinus]